MVRVSGPSDQPVANDENEHESFNLNDDDQAEALKKNRNEKQAARAEAKKAESAVKHTGVASLSQTDAVATGTPGAAPEVSASTQHLQPGSEESSRAGLEALQKLVLGKPVAGARMAEPFTLTALAPLAQLNGGVVPPAVVLDPKAIGLTPSEFNALSDELKKFDGDVGAWAADAKKQGVSDAKLAEKTPRMQLVAKFQSYRAIVDGQFFAKLSPTASTATIPKAVLDAVKSAMPELRSLIKAAHPATTDADIELPAPAVAKAEAALAGGFRQIAGRLEVASKAGQLGALKAALKKGDSKGLDASTKGLFDDLSTSGGAIAQAQAKQYGAGVFDGLDFAHGDIDALMQWVMLEAAQEEEAIMRDQMADMKRQLNLKTAKRMQINAARTASLEMDRQIRTEYGALHASGQINAKISFEDYKNFRTVAWGDGNVNGDTGQFKGAKPTLVPAPPALPDIPEWMKMGEAAPAGGASTAEQKQGAKFGLSPEQASALFDVYSKSGLKETGVDFGMFLTDTVHLHEASTPAGALKNNAVIDKFLDPTNMTGARAVVKVAKADKANPGSLNQAKTLIKEQEILKMMLLGADPASRVQLQTLLEAVQRKIGGLELGDSDKAALTEWMNADVMEEGSLASTLQQFGDYLKEFLTYVGTVNGNLQGYNGAGEEEGGVGELSWAGIGFDSKGQPYVAIKNDRDTNPMVATPGHAGSGAWTAEGGITDDDDSGSFSFDGPPPLPPELAKLMQAISGLPGAAGTLLNLASSPDSGGGPDSGKLGNLTRYATDFASGTENGGGTHTLAEYHVGDKVKEKVPSASDPLDPVVDNTLKSAKRKQDKYEKAQNEVAAMCTSDGIFSGDPTKLTREQKEVYDSWTAAGLIHRKEADVAGEKVKQDNAVQKFMDAYGSGSADDPAMGYAHTGSVDELNAYVDKLKGDLDSMSEMGEIDTMRLQVMMDRRSKLLEAISNLMKKSSQTADTIIGNLK